MSKKKKLPQINEKYLERETKKLNDKCEPIAQKVISIIAKHNLRPQEYINDHEGKVKALSPIYSDVIKLMKEEKVTYKEVDYIWVIVASHINQLKELSTMTIEDAKNIADNKLWDVEDVNDITLQMIDNVLQ